MSVTDIKLWQKTAATSQPKWENRAKILAHFLRPGDVVLDLGAGDRKLRKYLPENCGYIPVDCTDTLSGTFVVDFNEEFRLPDQEVSVIVSAGFLEYMSDLEGFLQRLASARGGTHFLFTISYGGGPNAKNGYQKLTRFRDPDHVMTTFGPYSCDLQHKLRVRNCSYFSCTLSTEPQESRRIVPINIAMKGEPVWRKWRFLQSMR